jgi:hypothetical protein
LGAIGFVQICIGDRAPNNGLGATLFLNLRQATFNGPIIGRSTRVSFPDNFKGNATFLFTNNPPVTPGQLYFFEPVVESGDVWGIYGEEVGYTNGFPVIKGSVNGIAIFIIKGSVNGIQGVS